MEQNVCTYMACLAGEMRQAGKDSKADLFRAVSNRLRQFAKKAPLSFGRVTAALVDNFAQSLYQDGLAVNTVNSYLSGFRVVYNTAREAGLFVPPAKSPFAHLHLRREITSKRALSSQAINELARMQPSASSPHRLTLDLFLFCYMACGMPFIDLAHLTHDNIRGKDIVYHRSKTGTRVQIAITPAMRLLLKRYARKDSRYLFPILPEGGCSHERYKSILARYNACLHKIGNSLRQPVKLTSYVARHSWATEALRKNTPMAVIIQGLGHTSEKTTRIYLDSLDRSVMAKANGKIIKEVNDLIVGRA